MTLTTTGSQSVVETFVRSLVEERLDDAQVLLHHDAVVIEAGGLPFSGEYRGPQGFVELLGRITEHFELRLGATVEYLGAGQTVAMRGRMTFTSRASGRSAEVSLVELYEVRDGLIIELDIYYKDPSAVAALIT